jgi:hypothetical protein
LRNLIIGLLVVSSNLAKIPNVISIANIQESLQYPVAVHEEIYVKVKVECRGSDRYISSLISVFLPED